MFLEEIVLGITENLLPHLDVKNKTHKHMPNWYIMSVHLSV